MQIVDAVVMPFQLLVDPRLVDFALKGIVKFAYYAYARTLCHAIVYKTNDLLVIH